MKWDPWQLSVQTPLALKPRYLINEILPAVSVNKGCHSHQWLQPSNASQWALRKLRKERIPAIYQPSDCSHCLWWAVRKLRMWKHKVLAPESWGAYQRNDFSKSRLLHLPIHRKALNSLACDFWFSLFNGNLLMFLLPALCCKTPIYPGSPPHLLRAVLSGLLEMLLPGLEVLKIPAE